MSHREDCCQINFSTANAGASKKSAGTGKKPARASEKPAGASEKPAGAGEKSARAGEKSARASEKPARAGEKPARTQKDAAGRADLTRVSVRPIVVSTEVGCFDLAVEIRVEHRRRPRNVQFASAGKWSRPTLIKVCRWVRAGQWRTVAVVRGRGCS